MLNIKNLIVKRGVGSDVHTVHLPKLTLAKGEVVAITGVSGCGKSTLLESIGLLLSPHSISAYGLGNPSVDLTHWFQLPESNIAQLRAEKIGFMLQNGGLIPYLSVQENIELPRRILGKPLTTEHIQTVISTLGLKPLLHQLPSTLSIGERQRVALVRALAHEPCLLLADEPTAALDPNYAQQVFKLFIETVKMLGLSALVVSHDWNLVQQFQLRSLTAHVSPGACEFV